MLKILIVDDSLASRVAMRKAINETNHTVFYEARDTYEAISVCKINHLDIDLITMDIDMPDVSGITAVEQITYNHKNAKIIMVTSRGQESMVKKSIQAGAMGYILKPITKDALEKAIDLIFEE